MSQPPQSHRREASGEAKARGPKGSSLSGSSEPVPMMIISILSSMRQAEVYIRRAVPR